MTLQDVQINSSEHVVPHDGLQAGVLSVDVVEYSVDMSDEQVYRKQAVLTHVQFTRLTQTHVKYLTHTGRHTHRPMKHTSHTYRHKHTEPHQIHALHMHTQTQKYLTHIDTTIHIAF